MSGLWLSLTENILQILSACAIYVAARWLLGISTPQQDYDEVMSWNLFQIETKWYRGLEYLHQIRARNIFFKEWVQP